MITIQRPHAQEFHVLTTYLFGCCSQHVTERIKSAQFVVFRHLNSCSSSFGAPVHCNPNNLGSSLTGNATPQDTPPFLPPFTLFRRPPHTPFCERRICRSGFRLLRPPSQTLVRPLSGSEHQSRISLYLFSVPWLHATGGIDYATPRLRAVRARTAQAVPFANIPGCAINVEF